MADEEMVNESLGQVMKREAARAVPWGVMLLVVVLISGAWIKQELKEGVEFATQTVLRDTKAAVLDPSVKQSVRGAIWYTAYVTMQEAKDAVLDADTFVPMKRKVKEAIEYTARTAADQYKRVQTDLNNRK